MLTLKALTAGALGAVIFVVATLGAQRPVALSAADREEIELLSARYALALGTCAAEKYAALFAPPDGWFASGARGRVRGAATLAELIRSYDCAYSDAGVAPPHAPGVEVPYRIEVEPTPTGAKGMAYFNGGHYSDDYVKTPDGWRLESRSVVSNRELAAGLTAEAFEEIRRLVESDGGPYAAVYERTPDGWRFKSTGVVVQAAADGATATAYLRSGGRHEDVYVKAPAGWRRETRRHVRQEAKPELQVR